MISIHAPRTGSDAAIAWNSCVSMTISIHAPRTGSDHRRGRATDSHHISIHAPRTGSDDEGMKGNGAKMDFNPRSPHGERL